MNLLNIIKSTYFDAFKGVSKEVWLIATIQLINRSGMMVLPFLSLYLTEEMNWTLGMAAAAGTSFGAGGLVSAMVGGWLIDRIPVFRIMLWSLIGGGICFIFLTWISDFYLFVLWIFVTTFVADLLRPAAMAAISQFSNESNLARGISLLRMAINLGIALGPAVGGILIVSVGYKYIFIVDGITCILAGIFLYKIFKKQLDLKIGKKEETINMVKVNKKENDLRPSKDIYFLLFLFLNMIMLTMFFQILHTVPLFLRNVYELTESEIGIFFMMNGLLIFFTEMPIIYYFEKKKQAYFPMAIGTFLMGFSFVFLILDFPLVWISIILFNLFASIGEIINFPFISTLSIIRAGEKHKGKYIGYMATMFSIAFMLAPIVFMPFVDYLGYNMIWLICMLVSFIAGIGLLLIRSRYERIPS